MSVEHRTNVLDACKVVVALKPRLIRRVRETQIYMHMHISINLSVCLPACMHVYVCMYVCMYTSTRLSFSSASAKMYTGTRVHMHTDTVVCVYMYT